MVHWGKEVMRRDYFRGFHLSTWIFLCCLVPFDVSESSDVVCASRNCYRGSLSTNSTCLCSLGWTGPCCDQCGGRIKIHANESGFLLDGPGDYDEQKKCSWIIETERANESIALRLNDFAIECNWDRLYIFDGDSVNAPLIASLSGSLHSTNTSDENCSGREFLATSGSALLYFYSDVLVTLSGFNITYRICPGDCDGDYDSTSLVSNCSSEVCTGNCSRGVWSESVQLDTLGRASHSSAIYNNSLWIFGGYVFEPMDPNQLFIRWSLVDGFLSTVPFNLSLPHPDYRYGHSAVFYNNSMYVFGGSINSRPTDELWKYDAEMSKWTFLVPRETNVSSPLINVTGHTATLVENKMIVIFGLSLRFGFVDTVQEYNLDTNVWIHVKTNGARVTGSMGHSSVYDSRDGLIYVYGGYRASNSKVGAASNELFAYDPNRRLWLLLGRSDSARYLHAGVVLGRVMIIFGGNKGETLCSTPSCYADTLLLYDTVCRSWKDVPLLSRERYGHSAFVYNDTMHVFGGFDGVTLKDLFQYRPEVECGFLSEGECKATTDESCVWNSLLSACLENSSICHSNSAPPNCQRLRGCSDCLANVQCHWCESKGLCLERNSSDSANSCTRKTTNQSLCTAEFPPVNSSTTQCVYGSRRSCSVVCPAASTCSECSSSRLTCIWCPSRKLCTGGKLHVPTFPYGQCYDWMASESGECADSCEDYKSCSDCLSDVSCGWCDDRSMTGSGSCRYGGSRGSIPPPSADKFTLPSYSFLLPDVVPTSPTSTPNVTVNGTASTRVTESIAATEPANETVYQPCLSENWIYFTSACPACQCNGHATCDNQSRCVNCTGNTTGVHCEMCDAFFYGDARNGGKCERCECNGKGDTCHHRTGFCDCNSLGLAGKTCDRCLSTSPSLAFKRGFCYYDLSQDRKYVFEIPANAPFISAYFNRKISSSSLRFVFENKTSELAVVSIFYSNRDNPDSATLIERWNTTNSISRKLNSNDIENITDKSYVYVRVESFTLPYSFEIGLAVPTTSLALADFFLSFFGCFFALLLLAALVYKIRGKYNRHVARREREAELEMMAKRPFGKIKVLLNEQTSNVYPICRETCKTGSPTPAVCSFLIELPLEEDGKPATGQSALCIGSTLMWKGNKHHRSNGTSTPSKPQEKESLDV